MRTGSTLVETTREQRWAKLANLVLISREHFAENINNKNMVSTTIFPYVPRILKVSDKFISWLVFEGKDNNENWNTITKTPYMRGCIVVHVSSGASRSGSINTFNLEYISNIPEETNLYEGTFKIPDCAYSEILKTSEFDIVRINDVLLRIQRIDDPDVYIEVVLAQLNNFYSWPDGMWKNYSIPTPRDGVLPPTAVMAPC